MPKTYERIPTCVQAIQYKGDIAEIQQHFDDISIRYYAPLEGWSDTDGSNNTLAEIYNYKEDCWINCPVGHWVIQGISGEYYPCDPEVFAKTYKEVD